MDAEDLRPFRLEQDGDLLTTVGLAVIRRPELTMRPAVSQHELEME